MQLSVKSRGLESDDSLREYVERKVSRLDRYLSDVSAAEVELAVQNTRSAEHSQVAQITLRSNHGGVLRSEERSADMRSSIDAAMDKMERQIKNFKGKHWRTRQRHQVDLQENELADAVEPDDDSIESLVRVKEFRTRPMDVEEAIEQMELLGHDFFVFYNVATANYAVVYKRRGEGYGLLLPELL
jgi:putative sigma-54 modulation protein